MKWSTSIGGSSFDNCNTIIETSDNKLLLAGTSFSTDMDLSDNIGLGDIILIQSNDIGEIEWIKNYGGTKSETAFDMIKSKEGGFLLVGGSQSNDVQVSVNNGESDVWIVKLSDIGEIQWELSVGDTLWDDPRKVIQNKDGDYLILSRSQKVETADDYLLSKVDQQGNLLWNIEYGGSENEWPCTILETNDGYILIGSSQSKDMDISSNNGELDYWILKIDHAGDIMWEVNYGGIGSEVATSALITKDGNIVIAGRAYTLDPSINGGDFWMIKVDQNGTLLWEQSYGGSNLDNPNQIKETTTMELLVVGFSSSNDGDLTSNNGKDDFWLLQLDQYGEKINTFSYGGSEIDRLHDMILIDDRIIAAGYSNSNDFDITSNNGRSDIWFGEMEIISSIESLTKQAHIILFPNPTNEIIFVQIPENEKIISFSLLSINGQIIKLTDLNNIDISGMKMGYYIASVKTNKGNYQQKILVNNGM